MKKLFTILILTTLALPALAQFVAGPRRQAAVTIPSGGYIVPSQLDVTNVAGPVSFRISGASPVLFEFSTGATNSTTISNIMFGFQMSMDGTYWQGPLSVEWGDGNAAGRFPMLTIPVGGQQQAYAVTNLFGSADMSSFNWIRLYCISNHSKTIGAGADSNTMYITNMYFIQGTR